MVQSKIIRDINEKESCVIVGRCADFVLKDCAHCFSVFIHAEIPFRQQQIMQRYQVEPDEALKMLEASDRKRSNYCRRFTGKEWGAVRNYNLALQSSSLALNRQRICSSRPSDKKWARNTNSICMTMDLPVAPFGGANMVNRCTGVINAGFDGVARCMEIGCGTRYRPDRACGSCSDPGHDGGENDETQGKPLRKNTRVRLEESHDTGYIVCMSRDLAHATKP